MQHICSGCLKLLAEGDLVRVEVESTYHILKSAIAYALDKDLKAMSDTLRHSNCQTPKGRYSGE